MTYCPRQLMMSLKFSLIRLISNIELVGQNRRGCLQIFVHQALSQLVHPPLPQHFLILHIGLPCFLVFDHSLRFVPDFSFIICSSRPPFANAKYCTLPLFFQIVLNHHFFANTNKILYRSVFSTAGALVVITV